MRRDAEVSLRHKLERLENMQGRRLTGMHGGVYWGDFVQARREGAGEMQYDNGDWYSGLWAYDRMHGQGEFKLRGVGAKFVGLFDNDRPKSGTFYSSENAGGENFEWKPNAAGGYWTVYGPEFWAERGLAVQDDRASYYGEVAVSRPTEQQRERKNSMVALEARAACFKGDPRRLGEGWYRGGFTNALREGFGYMQYFNGDRYVGVWKTGMLSGTGVFYRHAEKLQIFGVFELDCAVQGTLYSCDQDGAVLGFGREIQFVSRPNVLELPFWGAINEF